MMVAQWMGINLNLEYFLLLLVRVASLIVSSPIFGRRNISNNIKIGFCVMVSIVFYLASPPQEALVIDGLLQYAGLVLTELLFGLVLGFTTTLFFSLVFVTGQIVDMALGFGMVNIYDPQSNTQIPITGNVFNIMLMLTFLLTSGHLQLIAILQTTVVRMPIGHVVLSAQVGLVAAEIFCKSFLLGVQLSMPILVAGLLTEAALGIIIRTVPQMNMFVVGMPIKVVLGLLFLLSIIPAFVGATNGIIQTMFHSIDSMFGGMVASP